MKNTLFSLFIALAITLFSCNKEDPGNPVDVQFEFNVVGTVAEQTP